MTAQGQVDKAIAGSGGLVFVLARTSQVHGSQQAKHSSFDPSRPGIFISVSCHIVLFVW
jgi:hypothetical protein